MCWCEASMLWSCGSNRRAPHADRCTCVHISGIGWRFDVDGGTNHGSTGLVYADDYESIYSCIMRSNCLRKPYNPDVRHPSPNLCEPLRNGTCIALWGQSTTPMSSGKSHQWLRKCLEYDARRPSLLTGVILCIGPHATSRPHRGARAL